MKFTFKRLVAFFLFSKTLAQNITCPILDCTVETGGMVPGVCFESDGRLPTRKLRGGSCSQTFSGVTTVKPYCPFSYLDDQYSWIKENLQGQQA